VLFRSVRVGIYAVGRLDNTEAAMGRRFDGSWGLRFEDRSETLLVPSHGRGRLCSRLLLVLELENKDADVEDIVGSFESV
jgi:hypothetical protein